jgi:hypothetical protein
MLKKKSKAPEYSNTENAVYIILTLVAVACLSIAIGCKKLISRPLKSK